MLHIATLAVWYCITVLWSTTRTALSLMHDFSTARLGESRAPSALFAKLANAALASALKVGLLLLQERHVSAHARSPLR